MKRFSGLFQFVIGFFIGLVVFAGAISLLGYFVFSRLAATPNRPVFPEETKSKEVKKPVEKAKVATDQKTETDKTKTADKTDQKTASPEPKATEKPASEVSPSPSPEVSPSPSPEVSPSPSPEAKETLPAGAYRAKVIRSEGLSLRGNPSKDAEKVGGVAYNANLIVLETNGEWVKVKLEDGSQEGWVRGGNLKKEE